MDLTGMKGTACIYTEPYTVVTLVGKATGMDGILPEKSFC
jgi:hypothetical protein